MTDANRSAVYAAEALVVSMIDRGADVDFHGSLLSVLPDRKFGQVGDIERYLAWLRGHDWAALEVPAVRVRQRRGAAKAAWEAPDVMAIPDADWARRELVVLHEYAHHVVWHRTGGSGHGPAFCTVFTDLVRNAVGPEAGLLLTDAFYQAGLLEPAPISRARSRSR
jgi:putative metallohydrolase (TIGR04338 family)